MCERLCVVTMRTKNVKNIQYVKKTYGNKKKTPKIIKMKRKPLQLIIDLWI